MRSRERRWAGVSQAAAALALDACAATAPVRPPPRAEAEWIDATSPTARPAAAPRVVERWDLADQLRRLQPAAGRAPSDHRGGDAEAEILASPGSGYPLRGPAGVAPAGAILVERLFLPGQTTPESYLVMIKRTPGFDPPGGDWEYLSVNQDGRIEARGALPFCSRCHAEAPHDHLFGKGAR